MPPDVSIDAVTNLTSTSATLNGEVTPNDPDNGASYTFSWGTAAPAYGNDVSGTTSPGTTPQSVSAPISGLSPGTTYHYKLCATNTPGPPGGTKCSDDQTLTTTDAPDEVTGAATNVTTNGATLNGTVNPNGANVTSTFFKYGPTASYGSQASASPSPGAGRSAVPVSATLTGLAAGATYHYSLCATNNVGPTCDASDHTFTTNMPPTATLTADKTSGPTPLTVTFGGQLSADPDGSIASWVLQFGTGEGQTSGTGHQARASSTPTTAAALHGAADRDGQPGNGRPRSARRLSEQRRSRTCSPRRPAPRRSRLFDGSTSADQDPIALKSWSLDFADGTPAATGLGSSSGRDLPHYTSAGTSTRSSR